jgi:hypothetical protein
MVTSLTMVSGGETALARGWGLISARAVPEDALSRAPNHYAGIKRQNRVGAPFNERRPSPSGWRLPWLAQLAMRHKPVCLASAVRQLVTHPSSLAYRQPDCCRLVHPAIRFVMANISMRLGFIASAPAIIWPLLEHARMAPAADTQFQN